MRLIIKAVLLLAVGYVLLCVLFMLGYTFSGGWDYEIALPRGYRLMRVYSEHVMLTEPPANGVIIAPVIDEYAVLSDLVVGHVSPSDEEMDKSVPGYFILDTRNRIVYQGLSKEEWTEDLRRYGISIEPILRRPIRPLFPIFQ